MFTKCTCNNCSTHLEFDSTNEGETIQCPKCGMDTTLYIPKTPLESATEHTSPPPTPKIIIDPPKLRPAPQAPPPLPPAPMTFTQGVFVILLLAIGFIAIPILKTTPIVPPPRWEYAIVSAEDYEFDRKINKLGNAGWELVFARRATTGGEYFTHAFYEMIFKRPAQE